MADPKPVKNAENAVKASVAAASATVASTAADTKVAVTEVTADVKTIVVNTTDAADLLVERQKKQLENEQKSHLHELLAWTAQKFDAVGLKIADEVKKLSTVGADVDSHLHEFLTLIVS